MKAKFNFLLMGLAIYFSIAFVCLKDGIYPHPSDCHKYIECSNGIAYELTCPPGLAFNPYILCCDWENNVNCEGGAKRYTERIVCRCKNGNTGYRLVCTSGTMNSDVPCSQDSPCYISSAHPDYICY